MACSRQTKLRCSKKTAAKLLLFILLFSCAMQVPCSQTNYIDHTFFKLTYSLNDATSCMFYKVMIGTQNPQYTYLGGKLSTNSYGDITVVSQYLPNGNVLVVRGYTLPPIIDSFTLSSDSAYICFLMLDGSSLNLYVLQASDLSVYNQYKSTSLRCNSTQCKLIYDSINQLVFFYGSDASNQAIIGCTDFTAFYEEEIKASGTTILQLPRNIQLIESADFFIVTIDANQWGSAFQWTKIVTCPILNNCDLGFSESLISSDISKIYTLSTFGLATLVQALFIVLNVTDGSLQGNRYYSGSTSCTQVYSLVQAGSNLYSVLVCTGDFYIVSIGLSPIKFTTYKMDNGVFSYGIAYDLSTDRIFFAAIDGSLSCYFGKVPQLGIFLHPDLASSTDISFSVFDDSVYAFGTGDITITNVLTEMATTGVTQGAISSLIPPTATSITSSYSYILNSITINSVSPGSTSTYIIDSSCSVSTLVSAPVLSQSDGSNLPNWISFNSATNTISWTAPLSPAAFELLLLYCVADTTYTSEIGCTSITLKLEANSSSNSTSSNSTSSSSSTNNKYDSSQTETYSITGFVVVGAVLLFTTGLTAFNLSSMTVLWMVFGQMKMLQFLFLQDGYVSEYVKNYIVGFKFSLFSFSFFDIKNNILCKIASMKPTFSYLDFNQENSTLSDLGYTSGSAFMNNINLLVIIAFVIILHLLVSICYNYINKKCACRSKPKIMMQLKRIPNSFVLGAYIRIQIEAFQGVLITTISEVSLYKSGPTNRIVSLVLCIIILVTETILWIAIGFQWFSLRREINSNEWKNYTCIRYNNWFKELKQDINERFPSRGYYFIDITRTLLMVVLVFCVPHNQIYCIVSVQVVYLGIIVIIRPFDKVCSNIIKIQNEIYFMFFSLFLIYFRTQDRWSHSIGFIDGVISKISSMKNTETLIILLMTLNCATTMLITLFDGIIKAIKWLLSKKTKVAPKNSQIVMASSILQVEELKIQENEVKYKNESKTKNESCIVIDISRIKGNLKFEIG